MKILLLTNKSPWPPHDGGSAATLCMIKALSGSGNSVTVLAFNTLKHFVTPESIPGDILSDSDIHLIPLKTGLNPFKMLLNLFFSKEPYNLTRFRSAEYGRQLSGLLKNEYDIVQVEGLAMAQYLGIVRKESGAMAIFRPHNIESKIWSELSAENSNILRRLYMLKMSSRLAAYEKKVINQFDAVIPISRQDQSWFRSAGLQRPSAVIPSVKIGMNTGYTDIPDQSVFFIGSLDWLPNVYGLKWFIDEVWPIILEKENRTVFHIGGRNASAKTRKMFRKERIMFHGEVESSEAFFQKYSVMVVPLFSGSGLRIKIIEGMSYGKSIVATPAALEGIEYSDKRDLFSASDKYHFADCVISLLNDATLRMETGRNAIENVRKNYNILAAKESLLNFYSKLS